MSRRTWWARARALVLVAASCTALVAPVPQVFAAPAAGTAPVTDQVDSLAIDYRVDRDGTVQVTETIVYRFGDTSGRHGIYRDLVIREPYGERQDQRYDVTDVNVSSPTGADTSVRQEDVLLGSNRTKALRLRIGAPDKAVTGDTATYVINYQVRGAIRYFNDHSELYWNATGRNWSAALQKITVTVDVPDGVIRAACFAGTLGSRNPCDRANIANGQATYTHSTLPKGEQLTVVASINPGEVREGTTLIEPAAGPTSSGLLKVLGSLLGLVLAANAAALLYFRWNRSGGRGPAVTTPPSISVAESRLLTHAIVDPEATQATLLELALLGAIRLDTDEQTAVLVDADAAQRPHHKALLKGLFPLLGAGATVRLQHRGKGNRRLLDAQNAMVRAPRAEVATKGWFAPLPSASRKPPVIGPRRRFVPIFLGVLGLGLLAFVSSTIGTAISERPLDGVLVAAAALIAGTALSVVRRAASRGRLTGSGRELVRELRSFQRHLTGVRGSVLTDRQLIELLPWAMVLDRGDRWENLIEGADPVSPAGPVGMFRAGRFRRGVAAFTAGTLVAAPGTAYGTTAGHRHGNDPGEGGSGFSNSSGAGLGGGGGGGGSW